MSRALVQGLYLTLLLGLLVSSLEPALANPPQSASAVKTGSAHTSAQLKRSGSKPSSKGTSKTNKPFVIQETYREQAPPVDQSHGIVGLDMLIEPGRYPVVQQVFKQTPAHRSGVREGDVILEVNGIRTVGRSLWEVDALISDVPGDVVTLTLLRGEKVRTVDLVVMSLAEATALVRKTFTGEEP